MTTSPPYSRRWLLLHLRFLLLGLLVGAVAVGFRMALEHGERLRGQLLARIGGGPIFELLGSIGFALVTILISVWLVWTFAPETSGSGIPQVKRFALHPGPLRWFRVLLVKFLGGVLSIVGGLMLGREGPTVQIGAALGSMFAPVRFTTPGEQRQLLVLGAGAGLAGAFNAPLAGVLFVFEELGEDLRAHTVLAALLTAISADGICRWLTGQGPQIGTYQGVRPALEALPWFLLLGWLAGLLGVCFNKFLLLGIRHAERIRARWGRWILPVFIAVIVGVLGWFDPRWIGGGHSLIGEIWPGQLGLITVFILLVLRFILTIGSYATGAAGGLFAPLLVLGGLLGFALSKFEGGQDHLAFVVVGMAALFTGVIRAPLTAVLLMIEMAGAYALAVPLVAASLMAKLIADALEDTPIYEALMAEQGSRKQVE